MKKKLLSNPAVSSFCMELSLLLHAGIGASDGLALLAEDGLFSGDTLLAAMSARMEEGLPLSDAMRESGVFPAYALYLTEAGERTGRSEEAFASLAAYYDSRARLAERIGAALLYPSVLLLLMLLVIGVLLVRVLPVFSRVYHQLGGELTGLAAGLLQLGSLLGRALPLLALLLALCVGGVLAFALRPELRARVGAWLTARDRGISRRITAAHFASALAMGMNSGLPMEEALRLATGDLPVARYRDCQARMDAGASLTEALSGVFSPAHCRMLSLGIKSGSGDTVITEIARRMENEAETAIEETVSRVEPTLVIGASLLVGAILLSVMLPLLNIMSSIG